MKIGNDHETKSEDEDDDLNEYDLENYDEEGKSFCMKLSI